MPSFAQSLEKTLHTALANASERSHEYATLEHLLLALIDDADAAQVMQACGVDLGDLGDVVRQYLDQEYQSLKTQDKADPQPTAGFQRVIQRAILHVQSSGKDTVTGANVLVALFSERDSYAVYTVRYWLTDLAIDEITDSAVRIRAYFALRRARIVEAG